jgi:uncharacterized protein
MSTVQPTGFFDDLRQRRRDLFRTVGPGAVITILAFLVAFYFVEPPPPDTIVVATGVSDGRYHAFALECAELFARDHVTLDVRATLGSVENFDLLLNNDDVNVAIVQGGTMPEDSPLNGHVEALATLYFEPLWVFHRADLKITDLVDVKGQRIAVGEVGSGSHSLAERLLTANGVADGSDGTTFVNQNATEAADALETGEIDVAMFVLGPEASVVKRLLERPDLTLMDFDRQAAYSRRFSFLSSVVLEEGVVDLNKNLPAHPVRLLAPGAILVATDKLHHAFIPLLMKAILTQHRHGGLLTRDGELPTLDYASFPVNATARQYFVHGPTFFQQHLGFWVASLLDRTKILIIPLLTLLIPLFKIAPPLYRWRIRSRIYRWYGVLRRLDQQCREDDSDGPNDATALEAMSRELDTVSVPLSYMEEFYNLRLHVNLVKEDLAKLKSRVDSKSGDDEHAPDNSD